MVWWGGPRRFQPVTRSAFTGAGSDSNGKGGDPRGGSRFLSTCCVPGTVVAACLLCPRHRAQLTPFMSRNNPVRRFYSPIFQMRTLAPREVTLLPVVLGQEEVGLDLDPGLSASGARGPLRESGALPGPLAGVTVLMVGMHAGLSPPPAVHREPRAWFAGM